MKCPKCRYITYDEGDRCRNCGYDFSLTVEASELDLPIKTGDEALGPYADFDLADLNEPASPAAPTPPEPSTPRSRGVRSTELPLFIDRGLDDDRPLVSLPAVPRAPMSVRKSTTVRNAPERATVDEAALDLEPPVQPRRSPMAPPARPSTASAAGAEKDAVVIAPPGARLLGAGIDVLLLGTIDLAVLYFTLRLCGLTFAEASRIPAVPFAAFLVLLNGGYMAAFTTAGGQSIGKMIAGTKVVAADHGALSDRVPLGQAIVRAIGYFLSALPAGLGFLPALFSADGRAVHDRLAHTRVVRA